MTALDVAVAPDPRLTAAWAELPPISLEELIEDASLLQRVDRKYVLPVAAVAPLLAAVPSSTRILDIDGRRTFGYSSTYLDTDDQLSFLLAGQGRRRRFKVRTRSYLDTGSCWLEVKTRGPRGVTVKERIPHPDADLRPLTDEGHRFVDEALAGAGLSGVRSDQLRPVLVSAYRRTTLHLPGSRSRATIDVGVRWRAAGNQRRRELACPDVAIVETKTGSTPSELDRLLWAHGHRPSRISKFGVGMAALHPELPRLKWHRAMQRHLTIPRAAHLSSR